LHSFVFRKLVFGREAVQFKRSHLFGIKQLVTQLRGKHVSANGGDIFPSGRKGGWRLVEEKQLYANGGIFSYFFQDGQEAAAEQARRGCFFEGEGKN